MPRYDVSESGSESESEQLSDIEDYEMIKIHPLVWLIINGNINEFETRLNTYIINNNFNVDSCILTGNEYHGSLFYYTALYNRVDFAELLIKKFKIKLYSNCKESKNSCLSIACLKNNIDFVNYLISM